MSRNALMWGGVLAAGAATLTACSSSSTPPEGFKAEVTTEMPAPTTAVDSLVWNLANGEPTSLDPALSALESNSTVVSNMCESLMTPTPSGEVAPGLAESVEYPDDRTWVVTLRDDATFWDGNPVTPEDVIYSATRILEPELGSSWGAWAVEGIDSIEATGDNEVTIKLASADAIAPSYLATPAFAVIEKAFAEEKGAAFGTAEGGVMCTGPYQLDEWNSGSSVTLTRNDTWWNTAVEPKVESVEFTFTTDPSAIAAGLSSGDIDGAWMLPVATYSSLDAAGNLLFGDSLGMMFVPVLSTDGPLGDLAVRQALQASVNYEGIAAKIWDGTAEPLRALVPPTAWGYAPDVYQAAWDALPEAKQDTEKAKSLVEESSYDDTPIVLAYFSGSEEDTKTATVIADGANSVGLNVELKPLQSADYSALFSSDPAARAGIDAFATSGYLDFPEPAQYYQYFTTESYYNFVGYSNPEYDALITAALKQSDPDARAELVSQAQAITAEEIVTIPLVSQYISVYYPEDLTGLVPSPSYLYAPWLASLGGK